MLSRHERRQATARKPRLGDIIWAQTIRNALTGDYYWFETPSRYSFEQFRRDGLPPGATLHGPFKTHAEVSEDQRLVLLGPQCEIVEGGVWDPAWDRPQ
jgi:hypothetical protein